MIVFLFFELGCAGSFKLFSRIKRNENFLSKLAELDTEGTSSFFEFRLLLELPIQDYFIMSITILFQIFRYRTLLLANFMYLLQFLIIIIVVIN